VVSGQWFATVSILAVNSAHSRSSLIADLRIGYACFPQLKRFRIDASLASVTGINEWPESLASVTGINDGASSPLSKAIQVHSVSPS
jgi:hypothetical protein